MADRNFDPLVERFSERIYRSLKGRIRLAVIWRDIEEWLQAGSGRESLQVLDAGCGLAQTALRLAAAGHRVVCNDVSANMLERAQELAPPESGGRIEWREGCYSGLLGDKSYDLLLAHALIEWLEQPLQLVEHAHALLHHDGCLSLCFYNTDGRVYRNLIRGNFDWLDAVDEYQHDGGSLTPNFALAPRDVISAFENHGFEVLGHSGVRVFNDYVVERRGGLADEEQVIARELQYSRQFPFLWLGRYQHVMLRKTG